MCDTLCILLEDRALFAKSSDRPPGEVQLNEAHARRRGGRTLRTQYLEIPDEDAAGVLISRPEWLWGAEHGVSEHRVAIGNEKVYTSKDPYEMPPALIGMDMVRLGLERSDDASGALEVITGLIARYGQGGIGDRDAREPYFSSFLIADPHSAWILETSGSTWAAKPVRSTAAISNRLTLRKDWTRGSADLQAGTDFDSMRNPASPTGYADCRLDSTKKFLAGSPTSPGQVASHLRDHGTGPWGDPVSGRRHPAQWHAGQAVPPPAVALPDGTGVTVCMHVRGYQATTSSMITELPRDPAQPLRAWITPGSPCVSPFIPVFPPDHVPRLLGSDRLWHRFARLRDCVDDDAGALAHIRSVIGPLEADLWERAESCGSDPTLQASYTASVAHRVEAALAQLDPIVQA